MVNMTRFASPAAGALPCEYSPQWSRDVLCTRSGSLVLRAAELYREAADSGSVAPAARSGEELRCATGVAGES